MNQRIRELAEQCWDQRLDGRHFDREMFAELIIDECANWINENVGMINEDARADLHKHFGVEKCHFTLTQTNVGIAELKNDQYARHYIDDKN